MLCALMIAFVFAAMWRNRIDALVWGEAVPVSRKIAPSLSH